MGLTASHGRGHIRGLTCQTMVGESRLAKRGRVELELAFRNRSRELHLSYGISIVL